ncbi:MAG: hypothetical protein QM817_36315 [Archangium sp.]
MTPQGMLGPPPSPLRPAQQDQLNLVGIAFMVLGGLTVLSSLASLVFAVISNSKLDSSAMPLPSSFSDLPAPLQPLAAYFSQHGFMLFTLISNLLHITVGGVMTFGGFQLRLLKSYNIAVAACIAAMLPCSFCCIISLPLGIWGLTIVTDRDVKAAFT